MSEPASSKRRYDGSRRRDQATQTRAKIIDAASRIFLERGYVGATIPTIAAEAGVAVETVYRAVNGKAGLLAAAVQAAVAGSPERAARPVDEREGIRRVIDETNPRRKLAAYAATQPGVWSRVGPLLRVLDAAAGTDDTLVELRESHARQRLAGLHRFAQSLADNDALRPGLSTEHAADLIWTICAQANYDALVGARGWSHQEYREWLSATLAVSLLAGTEESPGPS